MPAPGVPIDFLVNFESLRQQLRQTLKLAQTEGSNKHGERVQPSYIGAHTLTRESRNAQFFF